MSYFGYTDYDYSPRHETRRKTPAQEQKEREKEAARQKRLDDNRIERDFRKHDREECKAAMRTRPQRQVLLGDECGSKAKRHTCSDGDQGDDEVVADGFIGSARASCTCEALDEEELNAQIEELLQEEKE